MIFLFLFTVYSNKSVELLIVRNDFYRCLNQTGHVISINKKLKLFKSSASDFRNEIKDF
jgi:hypothetical protein